MELIAHRGVSSEAPENTFSAFERAVELNLPWVELDIQCSQDGHLVVFHDDDLVRTASPSSAHSIANLPLSDLRRFDVGSWFAPRFAGERIPTFEEVLQWRSQQAPQLGLMVELKSLGGCPKLLVEKSLGHLQRLSNGSPTLVGSLDPRLIAHLIRCHPNDSIIGIAESMADLDLYLKMGLARIALSEKLATPKKVAELLLRGLTLWVWTVDERSRADELARQGVQGLITNAPGALTAHLR